MTPLMLALLIACGDDKAADTGEPAGVVDTDTAAGADDSAGSSPVDTEAPYEPECGEVYTWETAGAPFVYTWCTGCHSSYLETPEDPGEWDPRQGAPEGLDFDSLERVCEQLALIESAVFGERMPPSGGPSQDELDALRAWIDCGPPECG